MQGELFYVPFIFLEVVVLQRGTLCIAVCRNWFVGKLKMVPNIALLTRGEKLSFELLEMKCVVFFCALMCYCCTASNFKLIQGVPGGMCQTSGGCSLC